ncbi:hypothetical protein C2R69_06785 [Helicobacter pylori]|nr:hypothetical protein C2R69_06785 [Helicobacter pylori]
MYPKVILRSIGGFFGSFSSNASFIFSFIFSFSIVSFSFIFFLRNHSYTQKKNSKPKNDC